MTINRQEIKKRLFDATPDIFCDPVTGYPPRSETELTAMLALLHQRHIVRWRDVPLYSPTYERSGRFANSIFVDCGPMACEYPMFSEPSNENIWGGMKADLLYVSDDQDIVVMVENKLGSAFTSGGNDVEAGQLARQIEYLNNARKNCHLVLLSAEAFFEANWYCGELVATLKHKAHCTRVQAHLIKWEDIFQAAQPRKPTMRASGSI